MIEMVSLSGETYWIVLMWASVTVCHPVLNRKKLCYNNNKKHSFNLTCMRELELGRPIDNKFLRALIIFLGFWSRPLRFKTISSLLKRKSPLNIKKITNILEMNKMHIHKKLEISFLKCTFNKNSLYNLKNIFITKLTTLNMNYLYTIIYNLLVIILFI